jgi:hypothetical protein
MLNFCEQKGGSKMTIEQYRKFILWFEILLIAGLLIIGGIQKWILV